MRISWCEEEGEEEGEEEEGCKLYRRKDREKIR